MRHCSLGLRSCEASLKYVMTGDVVAKMFSPAEPGMQVQVDLKSCHRSAAFTLNLPLPAAVPRARFPWVDQNADRQAVAIHT